MRAWGMFFRSCKCSGNVANLRDIFVGNGLRAVPPVGTKSRGRTAVPYKFLLSFVVYEVVALSVTARQLPHPLRDRGAYFVLDI